MKARWWILLFVFNPGLFADEYQLDLVRTIGDDRPDCTFFLISDAKITERKEIFIADNKGCFLAKFDWNGNLIKKIGKSGNGPGDFNSPGSMTISGERLSLYDFGNSRIFLIDTNLQSENYVKLNGRFATDAFQIDKTHWLGDYLLMSKERGRIGIINEKGQETLNFFQEQPIGDLSYQLNRTQIASLSLTTRLKIAVNDRRDLVLVTFSNVNNPIQFYLYSMSGIQKKAISYPVEKRFAFPESFLDITKKPSGSFSYCAINSICFWNDSFFVMLFQVDYDGKQYNTEYYLLLFDLDGRLCWKKKMAKPYHFFQASREGYLLARDFEADDEKLLIFQIKKPGGH